MSADGELLGATTVPDTGQQGSSDQLDARLLKIAGVCVLGSMMAIVDTTVVTVAQRTFVSTFDARRPSSPGR
ncbi:putative MULTIDRUG RESISTANCE INTEGRAL MEMBRANE EFFLUX PROTEIN EMRB domain protein [Mycobacterium ulcerans str. Harvey]|uniref:MULTIDRUG RESISTANCE INTEGRAL MEMBRANE EFFLUX PROTEIN EMRB domain protein n=1 Tax=Mycobacterium ulcerans str. Harvey TaxID=1299332 RepID=A0ABP3ARF8_MYCUL|nr:putative MULTIDRUG RESISTANCE INTEGRAL MEMBRANE EFFLUX PROTEIN EMRB domain protein [Mycobacterium ulcerans str. Harvey]